MRIRYLQRNEIDEKKWDACVNRAVNGVVFAQSWYLDLVAEQWDALVDDEYNAVFPIVYKKNLRGLSIYNPPFTRYLGLFSHSELNGFIVNQFIDSIPRKYKRISVFLNPFNSVLENSKRFERVFSYNLDLMESQLQITSNLSCNTRNAINRAIALGVFVQKNLSICQIVNFLQANQHSQEPKFDLNILKRIIVHSTSLGVCQTYGCYTNKNELCAAGVFIRSLGKLHCIFCAQNDEGRDISAAFLLIDSIIAETAPKPLVLEFDGMDKENEFVFSAFASAKVEFFQYKKNRRLF